VNQPWSWPRSGRRATQLDEAVTVLDEARAAGRSVAAIALLVGGNDFLFLRDPDTGNSCQFQVSAACIRVFQETLGSFRANLTTSVARISEAKPPDTPLLLLNYYNPFDTGEDTPQIELADGVIVTVNGIIAEVATQYGAHLVDIHPLFQDRAATLIAGVDPTYEGHRVIADAMIAVYEAILAQPEPTPTPTATPRTAGTATPTPVSTVAARALPASGDGPGTDRTLLWVLLAVATAAAATTAGALRLARR
jgi:lysophospholipase L1-like esterase